MDSAWWAGDWWNETYIPGDGLDPINITVTNINDLWDLVRIENVYRCYCRDVSYGSGEIDYLGGGAWVVRNSTTGEYTMPAEISKVEEHSNEYYPHNPDTNSIERFDENAVKYINPFAWATAASNTCVWEAIVTTNPDGDPGDTYYIGWVGPFAFEGTPAEVVAAIFLKLGIDADWLDTDAIDNAYDGEYYDLGPGGIYGPNVQYAREIGVSLADSIKEIVAHSWDFLGYNMTGQLTIESRTRPTATSGLPGLLSIEYRRTTEHLVNTIRVTYGMVNRTTLGNWGVAPTVISGDDEVANSDHSYRTEWDPTLESANDDTWTQTYEVAASQSKYGVLGPGGRIFVPGSGDVVKSTLTTHMRLFMHFNPAYGYAMRVDQFDEPLRELTVIQDLRGLDYDIGHAVENVAVTGDGNTIPDMRCISKEIDFNNLTVTSVLLEEV